MKILSYTLLAAFALAIIYGFLMVIGEPTPGGIYDSVIGIIFMKLAGISCMASGIYGIKKLFS